MRGQPFEQIEHGIRRMRFEFVQQRLRRIVDAELAGGEPGRVENLEGVRDGIEDVVFRPGIWMVGGENRLVVKDQNAGRHGRRGFEDDCTWRAGSVSDRSAYETPVAHAPGSPAILWRSRSRISK